MIEGDSDNAVETEADDSDQGQKVRFLNGDPHLTDGEDDEEVVSLLLNPTHDSVCKKVPLRCQQNSSFLIDKINVREASKRVEV